jgi:hypothetical protein
MKKYIGTTATVMPWLASNLGMACLGLLTGTDFRALCASVLIVELYSVHPAEEVSAAFRIIVCQMQESTRELAYHAIAHVMDWSDRKRLWALAGLPPISNPRRCAFE